MHEGALHFSEGRGCWAHGRSGPQVRSEGGRQAARVPGVQLKALIIVGCEGAGSGQLSLHSGLPAWGGPASVSRGEEDQGSGGVLQVWVRVGRRGVLLVAPLVLGHQGGGGGVLAPLRALLTAGLTLGSVVLLRRRRCWGLLLRRGSAPAGR